MINQTYLSRRFIVACLTVSMSLIFAATSCSSGESKSKKVIAEYLKNQGVTDIIVDTFYTDPAFPDKAYTSATITYNFVGGDGKPQREFLGFILTRADSDWRVERFESYTKDKQEAARYLSGGK